MASAASSILRETRASFAFVERLGIQRNQRIDGRPRRTIVKVAQFGRAPR